MWLRNMHVAKVLWRPASILKAGEEDFKSRSVVVDRYSESGHMEFSLGLRKGAWMEEEDILLRKCIEKYGEGNWRQVPFRAGLRRCRKSCRLRWLNYLSPNIKRGEFTPDEVDLIIRLHKLLGNRWSLMAGRLPGRTANDIKNYWNTRLKKKFVLGQEVIAKEEVIANTIVVEKTEVIKPKPWIFTKSSPWLKFSADTTTAITTTTTTESREKMVMASPGFPQDDPMPWWDSVYGEKEGEKETSCSISGSREELSSSLWVNDMEDDNNGWDDFCFDGNLWDTLEIE